MLKIKETLSLSPSHEHTEFHAAFSPFPSFELFVKLGLYPSRQYAACRKPGGHSLLTMNRSGARPLANWRLCAGSRHTCVQAQHSCHRVAFAGEVGGRWER